MTEKEVEYTVMSIDKTKSEKRVLNVCKWFNRAGMVYLGYTAITMAAATGLGALSVGLLVAAWGLGKLSSKTADLAWEKNDEIYEMKKSITHDQYKTYHTPSKPVEQFIKIKSMIKNRDRNHGFKPSVGAATQ